MARVLRHHPGSTAKAVTHQALVRWALFQFLLSNSDAHGKNVSFFCRPEGLALAPFYDLVSVVQYEGMDHVAEEKELVSKIAEFVTQQAAKLVKMAPVMLKVELR